ncbi:sugar phosphate isomerase/epimerase family protein [Treponema sp.]|uniref:sugar phosphate isomerase/epimerase family protein n=1 Tax=Treponema sp. TaxID=166 RepID=UPI00298E6CCD|nr:TIM barrel protein [Treponema sp.]MCR5614036.1 TIM barrel protein [Treponema sp.]
MVKFGFQSSKYNNLNLEQELQFADINKIDFFDVFFDGFKPEDVKSVELPENFTVHLPIGFAKYDKELQQQFFDYINERKPKTVTIHFCELTYESLEAICTSIPGVRVCVENTFPDVNEFYNNTYKEFMMAANEYAAQRGFRFSATFDTGHAKLNGQDPVEFLSQLIESEIDVFTVHLHDNDGKEDSHRPAGSVYNGINFAQLLEILKNLKHDVFAVIEHWNNNYNALEYLQNL